MQLVRVLQEAVLLIIRRSWVRAPPAPTGVRLEPVVFWPAGSASDLGSRVPGCCYGSLLAFRSAGESRCVTGPGVVAGRSAPLGSAGGQEPARHAAAGLAEVMAMPAIWRDAAGNLLELPGPGGGIVVCGALPGTAAPVPAWTAGELAAAGGAG